MCKRYIPLFSAAILCSALTGACSRQLTHDEAKQVIEHSPLIRTTDNVAVDAISATNDSEAVVRATIAGNTTNLKFRRFDKGWTWEFVETKAGGWIAPDVAIGQIREDQRVAAAAKWAQEHRQEYKATASTMHILMIYVPNPRMGLNAATWMDWRHRFAGILRNDKRPEMQERRAILTNDHVTDAWGSEFLVNFDDKKNVVLLLSPGPDKRGDTDDDLVCIGTFRPDVEDGRSVWQDQKGWRIPENLGDLVEEYTTRPYSTVEFTKAVKF